MSYHASWATLIGPWSNRMWEEISSWACSNEMLKTTQWSRNWAMNQELFHLINELCIDNLKQKESKKGKQSMMIGQRKVPVCTSGWKELGNFFLLTVQDCGCRNQVLIQWPNHCTKYLPHQLPWQISFDNLDSYFFHDIDLFYHVSVCSLNHLIKWPSWIEKVPISWSSAWLLSNEGWEFERQHPCGRPIVHCQPSETNMSPVALIRLQITTSDKKASSPTSWHILESDSN